MSIQFTPIFQDSWNFMRNQRQTTRFFVWAFLAVSLFQTFLIRFLANVDSADSHDVLPNAGALSLFFFGKILSLLVLTCLLITIDHISRQQAHSVVMTLSLAFRKLAGVILLSIIPLFPLGYGTAMLLTTLLQPSASPSLLAIAAIVIGVYIAIRLVLTVQVYLFQSVGILQAIKIMWTHAHKKMKPLIIFAAITQICFPIIGHNLILLASGNTLILAAAALGIALINTFSMIFTYRFYTLFFRD